MAGKVAFSTDNKRVDKFAFPRLKLEKNEQVLLAALEEPTMAYVHTVNAPQIVDGQPIAASKDSRDPFLMEFIARPLCLGDEGTLDEKGSDPKNCPLCKEASESDRMKAPQRRFAMHVFKYGTKPGSFDLRAPYSGETVVWAFTDNVFGKLVDFANEFGDLKAHDLKLGPCTIVAYQKYDISIAAQAAWRKDKERQALTVATFRENQAPDILALIGMTKTKAALEEDLKRVRAQWAIALGTAGQAEETSLDEDLSGLLDNTTQTTTDEWAKEAPEGDPKLDTSLDDLLGGPAAAVKVEKDEDPAPFEKAPETAPEEPASEDSDDDAEDDFEKMLKGL